MTADWNLVQVLGDKPVSELVDGDVVSAVEFDQSGDYLATGDRGGRVRIYEKLSGSAAAGALAPSGAAKGEDGTEYRLWHEFQSHDAEFDYLKSLEIEEKINCLRWCKPLTSAFLLLTTNDKTIKLWRVNDKAKSSSIISSFVDKKDASSTSVAPARRLFPAASPKSGVCASPRRVFANGHAYHINSISLNSDCETFIRSDLQNLDFII
jgi:serine/threonine-protein phosphatase 2A regulatory subunit B